MPAQYSLDGVEIEGVPPELALYPFGVFTTFIAVDGRVLGWQEHLARLARDARILWGHELDEARVVGAVRAHLVRVGEAASVRVSLYPETFSLASPVDARGCRILVSSQLAQFPFVAQSNFAVCTVEYERELAAVKSTALLTQIHLRRSAQLAGYDDVLFRHGDEVREGATWAILAWRDGEVATPARSVLKSITAENLGRIAEQFGWRFRRRTVSLAELVQAELVLAANVNCPARAIQSMDGVPLAADEDLLTAIANAYTSLPRELVSR